MTINQFDIDRSWATEPLFTRAPHPEKMQPREYQYAGAEYALMRRNALIGDAPGLGKTAQSLLISNAIEAEHTLVVCPAALRLNWEREIWRWSNIENVSTYPILAARDGASVSANYTILSYDLLRNDAIRNALLAGFWDHMILDEAHYLKDPKGNKRTQALGEMPPRVGRITMLSGTITPNQPIECLNAFKFLDWEGIDGMSDEDFRNYYYTIGEGFVNAPHRVTLPSGETVIKRELHWSTNVRNVPVNVDELRQRLRSHIMVRRLKEHVLTELPPMVWNPFPISTDPAMRKVMRHPGWAKAERLWEMDPDGFDPSSPFDGEVATAWRELGEAKAAAVADYCVELHMDGARKVVVGAWNRSVLAILREKLSPYGVTYMDGSTSPQKKQDAVDGFNADDSITFIVGQTLTIGEGWNLVVAQDVVNAQPLPTPGKNYQLLERINRFGQEGAYTIGHLPIVPNSLDERWVARAVKRDEVIHQTLDVIDTDL